MKQVVYQSKVNTLEHTVGRVVFQYNPDTLACVLQVQDSNENDERKRK